MTTRYRWRVWWLGWLGRRLAAVLADHHARVEAAAAELRAQERPHG